MMQNSLSDSDDSMNNGFRRTAGSAHRADPASRRSSAEALAASASEAANASEAARIERAREADRKAREKQEAEGKAEDSHDKQRIPAYDPKDPYAFPALMPSSADRAVRSFDPADFRYPSHRMDEWRYAPINTLQDFFAPFTAAGTTHVSAAFSDGTAVSGLDAGDPATFGRLRAPSVVGPRSARPSQEDGPASGQPWYPAGSVSKPTDIASAVEWQASTQAGRVWWLRIRKDVDRPIVISVIGASDALDAIHLVVTVDDDCHATVIVAHSGLVSLAEGIEIRTGSNSDLNFTSIQEWDAASRHLGSQRITVGANAQLRHNVVSLSGAIVRLRMDPDFAGPQGFADLLGIYFADPGQYMEHRTMVVHNHPQCKSRVIYKGALEGDGARSAWVGNALILPTAPKTDSYELNRNLVLGKGAVANSEPQLEIENGDIIGAGHASSVGRFDDEQLFYLESRGIPPQEARKLVVRGFFNALVSQIGVPDVCAHLMDVIDKRLARGESQAMAEVLEND